MDLIDLIGDTRTESLPAGFLRSIKMKYKHEASQVFPPGTPWKNKTEPASPIEKSCDLPQARLGSVASVSSTPSFMSWNIPSRLVHKYRVEKKEEPPPKDVGKMLSKVDMGQREALYSRNLSASSHKSLGSANSATGLQHKQERELLPKLEPNGQRTPLVRPLASPSKALVSRERVAFGGKAIPAADRWLKTASRQEKAVVSKILGAADTELIHKAAGKVAQPKAIQAVEKWLTTASDKEREIALKFFSSLAGTKLDIGGRDIKGHRNHTEGTCNACDRGRIEEALDALARGGQTGSHSKLLNNPSRSPNLGHSSLYKWSKGRLPPSVQQQYQTWHHLPVYAEPNGAVPNKSAMFIQPHKYYGRHFTIHPEWGFHKPLALK